MPLIVANYHRGRMILLGSKIDVEGLPYLFEVCPFTSYKCPAWTSTKHFRITLQPFWSISLWIYADRDQVKILAAPFLHCLLDRGKIRCQRRADGSASREYEIDSHILALHQIMVEVKPAIILVHNHYIWNCRRLDGLRRKSVYRLGRQRTLVRRSRRNLRRPPLPLRPNPSPSPKPLAPSHLSSARCRAR